MARFKFRLDTLMRLRENTRDERRQELAEAYRVDDLLKQRIDGVVRELEALKKEQRAVVGPGSVDVDRLVETQRYELNLKAQQSQFEQQRATVAEEIERRRERLVEADREVKVLEKLKEKQAIRHRDEEIRREGKLLDEVAQQKASREVVA